MPACLQCKYVVDICIKELFNVHKHIPICIYLQRKRFQNQGQTIFDTFLLIQVPICIYYEEYFRNCKLSFNDTYNTSI